jgi:hypothetical protein
LNDEFQKLKDAAYLAASQNERAAARFHPFTFTELMLKSYPAAEFVVDRLVPSPGVTVFSGDPATFKTWILLHIALCVSSGEPVFGQFAVEQGAVVIVDEENQPQLLKARCALLTQGIAHNIHFVSLEGFKFKEEDVAHLSALCAEVRASLVIMDSFIRVAGLRDENDAAAVGGAFEKLKPLLKQGVSVVIAHHNSKRASDGHLGHAMRGSSDILAVLDSHIAVKRDDKDIELTQTKLRTAEELRPFRVRVSTDGSGFSFAYEGEPESPQPKREEVRAAIIATVSTAPAPPYQAQIYETLTGLGYDVSRKTVYKVVNEMFSRGELTREHGDRRKWLYQIGKELE